MPYMPGLDGLRALAVGAVMVYHADHQWLSGGFLGVEVFFVISGYLITLLMIGEHERSGRVALGQFWKRRFRRLLPALFVMMGALALYLAVFKRRPQGRTRGDFVGGIFYGSNWYQIVVGQSYTAAEAYAPLRHLWSLAVEEQFYLLWPLVMLVILRRGRDKLPRTGLWLAATSAVIAIVVAVLYVGGDVADECGTPVGHGFATLFGRCVNVDDALYLSTFTRAGGLLLGAAFAMLWRPQALLRGPMRNKGRRLDLLALIGLAGLVALTMQLHLAESGTSFGSHYDAWLFRGGFLLTDLATLAVIAAVVHRRALSGRILGNPLLRWIGTRSYGLYLYHWPVYQIIRKSAGIPLRGSQFLLAMLITVPITEISYRFVETPIRTGRMRTWLRSIEYGRTRNTRRSQRRLVVAVAALSTAVGFAGVSLAVADNVCVGAVECSIELAGPAADEATPATPAVIATTTTAPDTSTVTSMTTAATSEPVADPNATLPPGTTLPETTTTPVPAPAIQPVALGESVMLGAIADLQAGGFFVDALKGRQGPEMAALVESMRANNQLGQVVVIQIGTNGRISDDDFDRIMAQLPPELTPTVVFLTVRVPKSWQDPNNELIRALPSQYPNVKIADWQFASGAITICSDGTHIACGSQMAQYYTNFIFDTIGRPDLDR